jgi:hypothetical protein
MHVSRFYASFIKSSKIRPAQRGFAILELIVALIVIGGISYGGYYFLNRSSAATCVADAKLVNPCRPWLGAWAADYPQVSSGMRSQIEYHEQRIGRQLDVVKSYKQAGGVLSADDKYFVNRANTYLLATWKPASTFGAAGGSNSTVNSEIDAMADSIKSVAPKKIFLSVWHEPENDVSSDSLCSGTAFKGSAGTPTQYKAMWANVRNRFNAKGVNNVVWAINYMGFEEWNCVVPHLWPGNDKVDWVLWDPYATNADFTTSVRRLYSLLSSKSTTTTSFTSKPWGLAEFSSHNTTQADGRQYWLNAKKAIEANTFPKLKMYLAFDSANGKSDNRVSYHCSAWDANKICLSGKTILDSIEQANYKSLANSTRLKN